MEQRENMQVRLFRALLEAPRKTREGLLGFSVRTADEEKDPLLIFSIRFGIVSWNSFGHEHPWHRIFPGCDVRKGEWVLGIAVTKTQIRSNGILLFCLDDEKQIYVEQQASEALKTLSGVCGLDQPQDVLDFVSGSGRVFEEVTQEMRKAFLMQKIHSAQEQLMPIQADEHTRKVLFSEKELLRLSEAGKREDVALLVQLVPGSLPGVRVTAFKCAPGKASEIFEVEPDLDSADLAVIHLHEWLDGWDKEKGEDGKRTKN